MLSKRLVLWKDGEVGKLVRDERTIQSRIGKLKSSDPPNRSKVFAKLVLVFKIILKLFFLIFLKLFFNFLLTIFEIIFSLLFLIIFLKFFFEIIFKFSFNNFLIIIFLKIF